MPAKAKAKVGPEASAKAKAEVPAKTKAAIRVAKVVVEDGDSEAAMAIKPQNQTLAEVVRLSAGARVVLSGLKAAVHLNGKHGTLDTFNVKSGRWKVLIDDDASEVFGAIKPDNLTLEVGAEPLDEGDDVDGDGLEQGARVKIGGLKAAKASVLAAATADAKAAATADAKAPTKASAQAAQGRDLLYGVASEQTCFSCETNAVGWYDTDENGTRFYCAGCWSEYDAAIRQEVEASADDAWQDQIIYAGIDFETDSKALSVWHSVKAMPREQIAEDCECVEEDVDSEVEDQVAPLLGDSTLFSVLERPDHPKSAHVVFMVDQSGSMRTEDVDSGDLSPVSRISAVIRALQEFFETQVNTSCDCYSLISFSDSSTTHFIGCSAKSAMEHVTKLKIKPAKQTQFSIGLDEVARVLLDSLDRGTPHLVILSDGRPGDDTKMIARAQELLQTNRQLHIHAIGFGDSLCTFYYLQQMAAIGNGMFAPSCLSMSSLRQAFLSVSSTITSVQAASTAFSFGRKQASQSCEPITDVPSGKQPRDILFEPANKYQFNNSTLAMTLNCGRSWFTYDGHIFHPHYFIERAHTYEVSMRIHPYTKGGMRLVHCFQDTTVKSCSSKHSAISKLGEVSADARMVAKLSKYSDPFHNSDVVVAAYARSSAVAKFYSRTFDLALAEVLGRSGRTIARIVFVECFLYDASNASNAPAPFMIAERYLPGVFLKYNSNKGYVNHDAPESEIAQAFSHFTFFLSGGKWIVLDLQGVHIDTNRRYRPHLILTDPQVVSVDGSFGLGDVGASGIAAFRKSHRCGPTCQSLRLNGDMSSPIGQVVRSPLEATGRYVNVRKHSAMGCAIISFAAPWIAQRVLEKYPKPTIRGTLVDLRMHQSKKTNITEHSQLFTAWGRQAEKASPLPVASLLKFFEKRSEEAILESLPATTSHSGPASPYSSKRAIPNVPETGDLGKHNAPQADTAHLVANKALDTNPLKMATSKAPGIGKLGIDNSSLKRNLVVAPTLPEHFYDMQRRTNGNDGLVGVAQQFSYPSMGPPPWAPPMMMPMMMPMPVPPPGSARTSGWTMMPMNMYSNPQCVAHSQEMAYFTNAARAVEQAKPLIEDRADARSSRPSQISVASSTKESETVNVASVDSASRHQRYVVVRGPKGQRATFQVSYPETLSATAIAREFSIPAAEQHLMQELAPREVDGVQPESNLFLQRKMKATDLYFTQDSIRPSFRDGRPIYQLLNDLTTEKVDSLRDLEPLGVVRTDGQWWCLDNRRLWALKAFGSMCSKPVWVRVTVREPDDEFQSKRTSRIGGASVVISRSRSPSPIVSASNAKQNLI